MLILHFVIFRDFPAPYWRNVFSFLACHCPGRLSACDPIVVPRGWRWQPSTTNVLLLHDFISTLWRSQQLGLSHSALCTWQSQGVDGDIWRHRQVDRSWLAGATGGTVSNHWPLGSTSWTSRSSLWALHWSPCRDEGGWEIYPTLYENDHIPNLTGSLLVLQGHFVWPHGLHTTWYPCPSQGDACHECAVLRAWMQTSMCMAWASRVPHRTNFSWLAARGGLGLDARVRRECNLFHLWVSGSCFRKGFWFQIEALIELTSNCGIWRAESQDERLRLAFVDFTNECKKHSVSYLSARLVCWQHLHFFFVHQGNRGGVLFSDSWLDSGSMGVLLGICCCLCDG